jgi:hypothetical protein
MLAAPRKALFIQAIRDRIDVLGRKLLVANSDVADVTRIITSCHLVIRFHEKAAYGDQNARKHRGTGSGNVEQRSWNFGRVIFIDADR